VQRYEVLGNSLPALVNLLVVRIARQEMRG